MITCRQRLDTLDYGTYDACYNMALDLSLFNRCEDGSESGFLRFYTWSQATLSLGYFEDTGVIDRAKALDDGVRIVRRPTGGRVVLHGDDLTYAVITRRPEGRSPMETYRLVSECIVLGLCSLGVDVELERSAAGKSEVKRKPCFVSTSRWEIAHRGRKVAGSAQKAGKSAILQHGSIPLGRGYLRVVDYMACDHGERVRLLRDISAATCCLGEVLGSRPQPEEVASALVNGFAQRFDLRVRSVHAGALGRLKQAVSGRGR